MINARTSKWFNYLIKLSFGVALLGALFYNIGISKIYQTLSEFSLWWLVPLFLLNIAILLLGAFNFIILLKGSETTVPYITLVRYYIISTTIGLFVPGKLGEFSMAFFLNKEGQPLGEATAINVLDKVVTLFLLSFIAVIGAFFYLTQSAAVKLLLSIVLLILFSLFLISRIGR